MVKRKKKIKIRLPDFSKKQELYKKRGEPTDRTIFKVGVPQILWTEKHKSYGSILLYDDMTEKDVVAIYHAKKASRLEHLRVRGITTRKNITGKSFRDQKWKEIVKSHKGKKTYKEIAKDWARKHPKEAVSYFLRNIWNHPENYLAGPLLQSSRKMKAERKILDSFLSEHLKQIDSILKDSDYKRYVSFNLPRAIHSAVRRCK